MPDVEIRTLDDFLEAFGDEETCARYLEELRWPRGFECPQCEHQGEPYRVRSRPYVLKCRACRSETSLTAGTMLARSRLALVDWFVGAWLATAHPSGVAPAVLQKALHIQRYETAYMMTQRLRGAMVSPVEEPLGEDGLVLAGLTETRGRPILILLGRFRRMKLRLVTGAAVEELEEVLGRFVVAGAEVASDDPRLGAAAEYGGYELASLDRLGRAKLLSIADGLRDWLTRLGAGSSGTKQLQGELNEYAFRLEFEHDPAAGFRQLLLNAMGVDAPTASDLYRGRWIHPNPIRSVSRET